ncbi:hypothetical protein BGZ73_001188, partial [Actinomortierella ambigua]
MHVYNLTLLLCFGTAALAVPNPGADNSISETCKDFTLTEARVTRCGFGTKNVNHVLQANCLDDNDEYVSTSIDLDQYIGIQE